MDTARLISPLTPLLAASKEMSGCKKLLDWLVTTEQCLTDTQLMEHDRLQRLTFRVQRALLDRERNDTLHNLDDPRSSIRVNNLHSQSDLRHLYRRFELVPRDHQINKLFRISHGMSWINGEWENRMRAAEYAIEELMNKEECRAVAPGMRQLLAILEIEELSDKTVLTKLRRTLSKFERDQAARTYSRDVAELARSRRSPRRSQGFERLR